MTKVQVREDSEGDWFIIPNELNDKFSELNDKMCFEDYQNQDTIEQFESFFNRFRTGGDLNNIQLYVNDQL